MKVTNELYKVRIALCASTPENRKQILCDDEKSQQLFLEHWNKGVVCARCQNFSSLGQDYSGMCGTCSSVKKTEYTRPEESCNQFVKRENIS